MLVESGVLFFYLLWCFHHCLIPCLQWCRDTFKYTLSPPAWSITVNRSKDSYIFIAVLYFIFYFYSSFTSIHLFIHFKDPQIKRGSAIHPSSCSWRKNNLNIFILPSFPFFRLSPFSSLSSLYTKVLPQAACHLPLTFLELRENLWEQRVYYSIVVNYSDSGSSALCSDRLAIWRLRPDTKHDWHSVKNMQFGIYRFNSAMLWSGSDSSTPEYSYCPVQQFSFDLSAALSARSEPQSQYSHMGVSDIFTTSHLACRIHSRGTLYQWRPANKGRTCSAPPATKRNLESESLMDYF